MVDGSALSADDVAAALTPGCTVVLLVGTPHPSPSKARQFQEVDLASVRAEGERLLAATSTSLTVLRPWYVLGRGHWWPYVLLPLYWVCERFPTTRDAARRLGLVTHEQILAALAQVVRNGPPSGTRVIEVPQIRQQ